MWRDNSMLVDMWKGEKWKDNPSIVKTIVKTNPRLVYMAYLAWVLILFKCLNIMGSEHFRGTKLFIVWYINVNHLLSPTEKAMAPHSSTLAWKIPWTEEPGGLQSMGLLRVRHDWATSLSFFTFMYWRRKWQPTPVFLPGESQGQGSLVGCCLWGRTGSDTTEAT